MSYTMRALKTSDIFKMSKILSKLKLKPAEIISKLDVEELNKTSNMKEEMSLKAGLLTIIPFVQAALENLHLAEEEVNAFLGDLVGISGEEFSELPIEDTFAIINKFKEQKGLSDFLKQAGRLMK